MKFDGLKRIVLAGATLIAAGTVGAIAPSAPVSAADYPSCRISVNLRHYSKGDSVNCLEKALKAKGYMSKYVNDYFGTATYGAVLRFQRDNGLYIDGIVGKFTATKLGIWYTVPQSSNSSTPSKTTTSKTTTSKTTTTSSSKSCNIKRPLSLGQTGSDVACYERFLKSKGWQSRYIDSYYGTYTVSYGTKAAERSVGLPVDGVADAYLLYKLGLWGGSTPSKPTTTKATAWNGKNGDCGLYPTGDAVLLNKVDQRLWMCRNGKLYGSIMPFTAGPAYQATKGEYKVFFKRNPWWGGSYRLDNFTAFTRGVNGGRIGFHKYVIMNESQVGSAAWRNRSGGCIRMRAADAKTIYGFLNYGETVRVLNNG